MRLSVSSYSFHQLIGCGKLPQSDVVYKAKELGFEGVEFTDLEPYKNASFEDQIAYAGQIREMAQKEGLTVTAYAIGANLYYDSDEKSCAEVERICRQLDVASALGVKIFRHDAIWQLGKSGNSRSFGLMLPVVAENARRISEYGASLGIKTCVENHGFIAQDSDRMERLFDAVSHDNFGLLCDIGNFLCADENPAKAVSRIATYAVHVHVKDMKVSSEKCPGSFPSRGGKHLTGAIVGEGDVPVESCLRILKQAGYNGWFTLEYEGSGDEIASVKKGYDFLKKTLEQI